MNLLKEFFNTSQLSFDPLNFLGTLATVLVSLYIFKNDLPFDYVRERHEKLIFPLFNLLEPSLYQQIDLSLLENACNIIEQNKSFADGKLLSLNYYCSHYPSQEVFVELCTYVDHTFDKSCRRLKLKRRSIHYRISRNQYKNKLYFIFHLLLQTLLFIISLVTFLFVLCVVLSFLEARLESSNKYEQSVFFLLSILISMVFYKYLEK